MSRFKVIDGAGFARDLGIAVVVMLIGVYALCFVTVGKGEVGVLSWFGAVDDQTLDPGPYLVHPLKKVYRMNTQTQKNEEEAVVPTKNGLAVKLKAVMLYHLSQAGAPKMAREVGDSKYEERVIDPPFRAAVRDACSEYPAEALYTSDRDKIEKAVFATISKELDGRGVVVESVMLLDPTLPDVVKQRIEQKVGAEQDAQRMEYVLKQKELEAKAKVVEAKGIADAQKIIKQDLDDNYLRYLWIMALKEHSGSIIYVPTGHDGLPFFQPVHPANKK